MRPPRASDAKAVGSAALTLVLLGLAVWVWLLMPTKVESWAPIDVRGAVGERLVGRTLAVTVHDVVLTRQLTFSNDAGPQVIDTEGVWLIADISFSATEFAEVPLFEVEVDGRHFTPVVSGFPSLITGGPKALPAGFTTRAVVAFELSGSPREATVLVRSEVVDQYGNELRAPLDSQLAVPVSFGPNAVRDSVNLDTMGRE